MLWLLVPPAQAGVAYRFQSVSAGITSTTLSGTVRSDRGITRADISRGDPLIFPSGTFVVTRAGEATILVANPRRKTFYELRMSDLSGATSVLGGLGFLGEMRIENERVAVRDRGAGPILAGQRTRRSTVEAACDVVVGDLRARVSTTADSWLTGDLPLDSVGFFQRRGAATGFEAIDRLIAMQSKGPRGFPMRQVVIFRVSFEGRDLISKTTTTVQEIRRLPIRPDEMAIPRDYRRVPSPLVRR